MNEMKIVKFFKIYYPRLTIPFNWIHLNTWCILKFTNIWELRSDFIDCESFLELKSPAILVLCETNLDDSIDSGNFCVRGYLPLILKDSSTHIHGLAVYVKEGLFFAWDLSLITYLYLLSVFFFLYQSPSKE